MHGEFMLVDNGKMSKSLGNVYTVTDLQNMGYSPMAYRFFCLNAHYRKHVNFTFEGLTAAATAYDRLLATLYKHKVSETKAAPEVLQKYQKEFTDAVTDDLNIPLALGILFTMLKEEKSADFFNLALDFDKVFGLNLAAAAPPEKKDEDEIPAEIIALADERLSAKKSKDYARSDALRKEIADKGYAVIDLADGYRAERKRDKRETPL